MNDNGFRSEWKGIIPPHPSSKKGERAKATGPVFL
jgi:hypothetical protein